MTKLSIVYYSSTGTNYKMARAVEKTAKEAGAETRLRRVAELAPEAAIDGRPEWRAHLEETQHIAIATTDDLTWADAFICGSPTRYGNIAAQLKQFIDSTGRVWSQGQLANKAVAGFTSAGTTHGGRETTLHSLYHTFYHWGCIIVAPGYTAGYTDNVIGKAGGNPYGVSTDPLTADAALPESTAQALAHMTQRVLTVASALKHAKL